MQLVFNILIYILHILVSISIHTYNKQHNRTWKYVHIHTYISTCAGDLKSLSLCT